MRKSNRAPFFALFAAFAACIFAIPIRSYANTTFNVDRSIGGETIKGQIVTDGTLGQISQADILDWNLRLEISSSGPSAILLGPLSGSNSIVTLVNEGSWLFATPKELVAVAGQSTLTTLESLLTADELRFTQVADNWSWIVSPVLWGSSGVGHEEIQWGSTSPHLVRILQGSNVIGSTSTVPLPAPIGLLAAGIALSWQCRRFRMATRNGNGIRG